MKATPRDALRQRAEALLGANPDAGPERELRLYQIELEMQNEALRQAQTVLEESRDRYLDLFEFAPLGYLTLDAQGRIAEANRAAAQLLDQPGKGLRGRRFDLFLPAGERAAWRRVCREAAGQGERRSLLLHLVRAEAAPLPVQAVCQPERPAGVTPRLRLALTDLQELKQAESQLRASEERYRSLFESSLDAIFLTHPDGAILAANPAAQRLFGYDEEEFRHLGRAGLVDASDPRLAPALEQRRNTGGYTGELTFLRRGGERVPVEISSAIYAGPEDGERACVIVRDIGERKRAQARLDTLRGELDRLLEWQVARHTVAALAHEVNQPLFSLCALAETVQRLAATESGRERVPDLLRRIDAEALRAGRVVRELLDSLWRPLGEPQALNLAELLSGIARQGDATLLLNCPPDLPPVLGLRLPLEKALGNLIDNARAAMAASGRRDGRIWIDAARTAENQVLVSLRDEGPGIDAATASDLFQPLSGSRRGGLGMGLAISRGLVEAMGGRLWHDAQARPGATFRLTLPCAGAPA